jgi:transcription elongation factor Elf1
MDEDIGIQHFDTTEIGSTCEICGRTDVEITPTKDKQGIKILACDVCSEKLRKERQGQSMSFLAYFSPQERAVLCELGITKSDNMSTTARKLLREVKRLREELKPQEAINASTIKSDEESIGNSIEASRPTLST